MPTRTVVHAEALAWLDENPAEARASVITSLPDISEQPTRDMLAWKAWFITAARRVLRWIPDDGVAIFYQSDIRFDGVWIDKGHLVARAADDEEMTLLWHKIVCRKPPGTISFGRATYSHMLCFSRSPRRVARRPGPDVLPDAGLMPWTRAMGVAACELACRYVKEEAQSSLVVDPFCGSGTALAVANALGLDAIGIDLSARRCKAARRLELEG